MKRVGVYYWAGPGTVRMIELKYPGVRVDVESYMRAYDEGVVEAMVDKLGITDAFLSYSWGFGEETEREDREYLEERLENFGRFKIRTHGYVQGTNLVYEEFFDQDLWCRDYRGRLIPYHRGRKMTCVNNPRFMELWLERVERLAKTRVDAVFVDNVLGGMVPVRVGRDRYVGLGCRCRYCKREFKSEVGGELPDWFEEGTEVFEEYLDFRERTMMAVVKKIVKLVKKEGKEFGTNGFDPKYDTRLMYGTDLERLLEWQDYLLVENHCLPGRTEGNSYLEGVIEKAKGRVFVVSYDRGIGREEMYGQEEVDAIWSEAGSLGYWPCYKASEFTTNGLWECLKVSNLKLPRKVKVRVMERVRPRRSLPGEWGVGMYNWGLVPVMVGYFENRWLRKLGNEVFYGMVR